MRKSVSWMVCGMMVAGLVLASVVRDVEARPSYLGVFKKAYPKLEEETNAKKCLVCHFGDSKKNRNDYGKAMGEALGGANIKDAEKVAESLKKIEGEKSSTEGKTFGDLIKDGMLPGKNP